MKLWYFVGLSLILAISACKPNDDFVDPNRQRSFLHIVNASADNDTFDITFDYYNANNLVISSFYFNRNWPFSGYASLEEGGKADTFGHGKLWVVASVPSGVIGVDDDTIMEPKSIELVAEEKSTMCLVDSGGEMVVMKFVDDYSLPMDTFALIRFINLKQEVVTANMASGDGVINVPSVAFGAASTYATVPRGNYSLKVDDGTTTLVTIPSVDLKKGEVYTFYLAGKAANYGLEHFVH